MLFGLQSARSMFQRATNIIVSTVNWQFTFVYFDDVVIFLKLVKEHLDHHGLYWDYFQELACH